MAIVVELLDVSWSFIARGGFVLKNIQANKWV